MNEEEEQFILESSATENEDINKIKKLAPNFNLSELLNCLEICKRLDDLNKNMHETNLNIALYILQKGLIEQRENQIIKLKNDFNLNNIPDYEDGKCPFEDPEKSRKHGIQYLESKIYKLKMFSYQKAIELYDKKIFLQKYFHEICVLHFGLSLKIPVILEDDTGQGKQTTIHYLVKNLDLEIINIVISKSTKVDDLLLKIIIEKIIRRRNYCKESRN